MANIPPTGGSNNIPVAQTAPPQPNQNDGLAEHAVGGGNSDEIQQTGGTSTPPTSPPPPQPNVDPNAVMRGLQGYSTDQSASISGASKSQASFEVQALEAEISALETELESLRKTSTELSKNKEENDEKLSELRYEKKTVERKIRDLKAKLEKLKAEESRKQEQAAQTTEEGATGTTRGAGAAEATSQTADGQEIVLAPFNPVTPLDWNPPASSPIESAQNTLVKIHLTKVTRLSHTELGRIPTDALKAKEAQLKTELGILGSQKTALEQSITQAQAQLLAGATEHVSGVTEKIKFKMRTTAVSLEEQLPDIAAATNADHNIAVARLQRIERLTQQAERLGQQMVTANLELSIVRRELAKRFESTRL